MSSRADKQTTRSKQDVLFADFSMDFSTNPFSGELSRITNENAVKQSIRNLVLTNRGERLYQPDIGGNVRAMLFALMDGSEYSTTPIRDYIEQTILNFEPRVDTVRVETKQAQNSNTLYCKVYFTLLNSTDQQSMDLTLKRVR